MFMLPLLLQQQALYATLMQVQLAARKRQLDARVPLDEITMEFGRLYGVQVLKVGSPTSLPKCDYCGLRGAGVRCDGCGAPKP